MAKKLLAFLSVGQAWQKVIVRAIGPPFPVPGKLGDPTLELPNGNGPIKLDRASQVH